MVERKIVITEKNGLHARPASSLVKCASKFKCSIFIEIEGKRTNAKSIMGVMALGIKENQEISIIADGESETNAMMDIIALIERNFANE